MSRASAAYREEIFGPVAMVFKVADEAEAVEVANDTITLSLPAPIGTTLAIGGPSATQVRFPRHRGTRRCVPC